MSLSRFSVNQSLFVNLVSGIIIVIGLIVLFDMNREIFPNVSFDIVTINTVYPGATPLDVEKLITVPLEKELKEVDGIKEIKSSSSLGNSVINVKIDPDESNKQKVTRDIESAVDRVKDLPDDIKEEPIVTEVTTKQYPIIEVSLSGDMPEQKLRYYADALLDEIEDIKGVAKVNKAGYRDAEIQIQVDPAKLKEYYVSVNEIEDALKRRNISIPAGKIDTETTEYSVRTSGEFTQAEEVGNVVIRANDAGNWLRIKDVAKVEDTFKKEDVIYKTLGTRSINLVVMKKEKSDAIDIVRDIKMITSRFIKRCPDKLKASYVNDYSFFTKRRLNVLISNSWGSLIIVIGCMLLFLQKRVAIMTVLGIPIAFFATFIIMSAAGITLNLISMFGLVIVLGMLVDDGIIVAENVYRYIEEGVPPRVAAVKGSEEITGAVLAAVLTTIAAFCPLLFMSGIIGRFIKNIPIVVIIALSASLIEALIALPSHLADFVKVKLDANGKPISLARDMKWFKTLTKFYTSVITRAIKWKYLVILAFIITLVISIFVAGKFMKFVLFPSSGVHYFFIRGEAPIGTPLSKTNELIAPVESVVSRLTPEEMESFVTSVGHIQEDRNDPFSGKASNLVQVTVFLTPERDRKRNVEEIMEDVREKVKDVQGFTELRFDEPETGPPVGKPVEVEIRGEDFDVLDKIAFQFIDYLKSIDGTRDVTWDHKPGKEEIMVKVDNNKASLAGLSVNDIARTVRGVFEGNIATKIKPVKAEEETDVTVVFPEEASRDISVFDDILVMNKAGNLIPLKKVAEIEKAPGTTTIHHLDGKRVVTASSRIDTDKITSMKINSSLAKKFRNISDEHMGYSVKYGGEQEESMDSLKSLFRAFIFAALVVYLILASFFRSIVHPFVVMLSIPFGLIGVIFAFLVHGLPLSFMAILGIVGLNGIVVNDAIVLVDFINKLRFSGVPEHDSIIQAGQMRIRAVLLTTITTVGGLATVAYGIGGRDPFLVPMALAICWGLIFSTMLTLIIIPCIYSIIDDITMKLTKRSSLITEVKVDNGI